MALFNKGGFKLYSGRIADWGIDTSALDETDWECIAELIIERFPNFSYVDCVTYNGEILKGLLTPYATSGDILLVDDVMRIKNFQDRRMWYRTRKESHTKEVIGYAVFACVPCPNWVRALWQLDVRLNTWESPL
jgi:hypothetical protein